MKALVVGGTGFLGGAIVAALAEAGHAVTVLARGAAPRPGVEAIRTDRHGDLSALEGARFDWVFDTCAYAPDAVDRLLGALGDGIERYVLVSSLSVYGTYDRPGLTEDDPVPDATPDDLAVAAAVAPADRASAPAYGGSYGPLKRACEVAAAARLGDRATALRVGLLVGAGDYTDRLTWWVRRIDEARDGRPVPVPGPPARPVQWIDVRDAAAFALRCAEGRYDGPWNVTGAPAPFARVLDEIADAAGGRPDIVWVAPQRVAATGLTPWTDVPLMPPPVPAFRHFMEVDASRARAAGLTMRPLAETLEPLLTWDRGRRDIGLTCGMTREQEAALLAAY